MLQSGPIDLATVRCSAPQAMRSPRLSEHEATSHGKVCLDIKRLD